MNSQNNIPRVLLKSSFLAFCIFWLQIAFEDFNTIIDIGFYIILSFVLIFIICSLTIFVCILIVYYIVRDNLNDRQIFKKFFPYSAILIFTFCAYCIVFSNFKTYVCIFFITVFFTLMQSWVWLCKTNSNDLVKT